jgi:hypothetical protein
VHWIEQLFHLDPDGGSGSLEMLILLAVIALVVAAAFFLYAQGGRIRDRIKF